MSTFKCKMCGGTLEIQSGSTVAECEYCGAKQTLPKLDDERMANLYDRANHFRRNNEFDKAMALYEQILNEDQTDAEAYWSLVLCQYGIEYVEDPHSHRRVPTVNRAQFTSIFDDDNYKSAIAHADINQRIIYQEEAKAINEIQKGILAISQNEEPFDIFICYKESDSNGLRTVDSVLAQDLYYQLTNDGFKVFFSRITLEDKLGTAYEPYIFAALNSAKVMVALGTKPEYFNAVWVKNEWSRFLALVKTSKGKKVLIPAYKDMDPYNLPDEFSHLQAQDMSKLGFMQDLLRGIKKICNKQSDASASPERGGGVQGEAAPIIRRAFLFLEDGEFEHADEYAEKVLDLNPECAEAYIVKLLIELELNRPSDLAKYPTPISEMSNFQKAVRFATPEYREIVEGYNNAIIKRLDTARKDELYDKGIELMDCGRYDEATEYFQKIPSYKDATQKIDDCKNLKEKERLDKIYNHAVQLMNSGLFDDAIELFSSLDNYKDSKINAELSKEKKEDARKYAIYSRAIQRIVPMDANDVAMKESIQELQTISGYRDTDDQIRALSNRLDKWYDDKKKAEEAARIRAEEERRTREREEELRRIQAERKRKARKKAAKISIISILSVTVLCVLIFTLVVPLIKYKGADKLFVAGNYSEAKNVYEGLNGFFASEKRIAAIDNIDKIEAAEFDNAIASLLDAGIPVKLVYSLDGGVFANSQTAASNEIEYNFTERNEFVKIETPTKKGYDFIKWEHSFYQYNLDGQFVLNLNAIWELKKYEINYTLNGGVAPSNPIAYNITDSTITLVNPTKEGYTFLGWSGTGLSITTKDVTIPAGSIGNRDYTAHWNANSYTISLDANGGSVASATQTVTYDKAYTLPTPTKAGCTFAGWYNGSTKVVAGTWKMVGNITVKAKWNLIDYGISYTLNGGTLSSSNPTVYTVNDKITLAEPIKTGYTFLGWTGTDLSSCTKEVTIAAGSVGDRLYEAHWQANTYTITLNANGGSVAPTTQTVTYDKAYTLPTPTKAGCTFAGWYNGSTKVVAGTWKLTGNISLTAKWNPIKYSISYTLNGGTLSSSNPTVYTVNDTIVLAAPSKTGYTFVGWTGTGLSSNTKVVTISAGSVGNRSYEAHWKANTYTITFNADGGSVTPATQKVTYDSPYTLPTPTWEAHVFSGWYYGSTKVVDGIWKRTSNITLTAKWDVSFDITYNLDGGTNSPDNPSTYKSNVDLVLQAPTKTGYTFIGWTGTDLSTCTLEVTIPAGSVGARTYEAHWKANTYTITFNANGGSVNPPTKTAKYGTFYTLPTPTRPGYSFLGWFIGTQQFYDGTWLYTHDVTLTAHWMPN